jgi:hypothetical protein
MRIDALLSFVPLGAPLSLIGGSGNAVRSGVIDLLGQGQGTAPTNIIGTTTTFGTDQGIGTFRPELMVALGPAVLGATSYNFALQAAPDAGTPTYLPGTWTTLAETGQIPIASLTLNQVVARFPWLPAFPANLQPRYLSLLMTAIGTPTAGTIAFALVTLVRDDQSNRFAAKNYKVQ